MTMSLTVALSGACLMFVIFYRLEPVVCASQHEFLVMISLGSFLQAAALIPFSMTDRDIGSKGLDVACMTVPWVSRQDELLSFYDTCNRLPWYKRGLTIFASSLLP
jgi:hypothetical protein